MSYVLGLRTVTVFSMFAPQALTATTNGASVDMKGTSSGGEHEQRLHYNIPTVTGTTPTLTLQVQDSPDNATFTNVINAVTATITTTAVGDLYFKSQNRYLRVVATAGGTTPSYTLSVDLYETLRNV